MGNLILGVFDFVEIVGYISIGKDISERIKKKWQEKRLSQETGR